MPGQLGIAVVCFLAHRLKWLLHFRRAALQQMYESYACYMAELEVGEVWSEGEEAQLDATTARLDLWEREVPFWTAQRSEPVRVDIMTRRIALQEERMRWAVFKREARRIEGLLLKHRGWANITQSGREQAIAAAAAVKAGYRQTVQQLLEKTRAAGAQLRAAAVEAAAALAECSAQLGQLDAEQTDRAERSQQLAEQHTQAVPFQQSPAQEHLEGTQHAEDTRQVLLTRAALMLDRLFQIVSNTSELQELEEALLVPVLRHLINRPLVTAGINQLSRRVVYPVISSASHPRT